MRRNLALLFAPIAAVAAWLWCVPPAVPIRDAAVLRVNNGSAVVVDSRGVILTAKHVCNSPQATFHSVFGDLPAWRVYESPESDGVVAYVTDQAVQVPAIHVAYQPATAGECLSCAGHAHERLQVSYVSGRRGRNIQVDYGRNQPFSVSLLKCLVPQRYAGGPVLRRDGQLAGITLATWINTRTTGFSSWADLQAAYRAGIEAKNKRDAVTAPGTSDSVPAERDSPEVQDPPTPKPATPPAVTPESSTVDTKPTLLVFVADWCSNCHQFLQDLNGGPAAYLNQRFAVQVIDIDKYPDIAATYGVKGVPVFIVGNFRYEGYSREQWGLAAAGDGNSVPAVTPETASPAVTPRGESTNRDQTNQVDERPAVETPDSRPRKPPEIETPPPAEIPPDEAYVATSDSPERSGMWAWLVSNGLKLGLTLLQPEIGIPTALAPFAATGAWWLFGAVRKWWCRKPSGAELPESVEFPTLPRDYSAIHIEMMRSAGQNPATKKIEYESYLEAYRLLMSGTLLDGLRADQQVHIFETVKLWVERAFREYHEYPANVSNVNHSAFLALLYKQATQRLSDGEFGMVDIAANIATAIERYVGRRFADELTQQ